MGNQTASSEPAVMAHSSDVLDDSDDEEWLPSNDDGSDGDCSDGDGSDGSDSDSGSDMPEWTMADVRSATKMGMFSPTDLFETFGEMTTVLADGRHALTRARFMECVLNIVKLGGGHKNEEEAEIADAFFGMMCDEFEDDAGLLDPRAVSSGLSVLCVGPRDAKVRSAFALFDINNDGYISKEEMGQYLTSVFKVLYLASPSMESQLNGVPASKLGSVTTEQVFEQCDVNHDGRLSFEEFKKWYGDSGIGGQ
jgi:Ca2+-binding EF-hand superfamily protein